VAADLIHVAEDPRELVLLGGGRGCVALETFERGRVCVERGARLVRGANGAGVEQAFALRFLDGLACTYRVALEERSRLAPRRGRRSDALRRAENRRSSYPHP
jgi:hypothetical protein